MILPTTAKVTGGLCMPCRMTQGPLEGDAELPRTPPSPAALLPSLTFELNALGTYYLGLPHLLASRIRTASDNPHWLAALHCKATQIGNRLAEQHQRCGRWRGGQAEGPSAASVLAAARAEMEAVLVLVAEAIETLDTNLPTLRPPKDDTLVLAQELFAALRNKLRWLLDGLCIADNDVLAQETSTPSAESSPAPGKPPPPTNTATPPE